MGSEKDRPIHSNHLLCWSDHIPALYFIIYLNVFNNGYGHLSLNRKKISILLHFQEIFPNLPDAMLCEELCHFSGVFPLVERNHGRSLYFVFGFFKGVHMPKIFMGTHIG
jgi:hypothetical protein